MGDIKPSWDHRELKKDPATLRDTPLPTPGGGGRGRGKPLPEGEEGNIRRQTDPLDHLRPKGWWDSALPNKNPRFKPPFWVREERRKKKKKEEEEGRGRRNPTSPLG